MAYEFPQRLVPKPKNYVISNLIPCPAGDHCSDNGSFLTELSESVAGIVQEAEKALVFVTVTRMVQVNRVPDLFEHFFGGSRRFHPPRKEAEKRTVSASGFFVDLDNGYIVTNAHVVKDSKIIKLTLTNGEEYEGLVTGADENTDIAVIQVAGQGF